MKQRCKCRFAKERQKTGAIAIDFAFQIVGCSVKLAFRQVAGFHSGPGDGSGEAAPVFKDADIVLRRDQIRGESCPMQNSPESAAAIREVVSRFRRTQRRIDATEEHIQVFQDQVLDSISSDIALTGHRATEPRFSGYRSSDSTARNGVICFHCKAKFGWEPTASVHQGQTMSKLEKHLSRTRAIMHEGTKKGISWASSKTVRRVMQGNRSRDTKPEMAVRRAVHALGLRYRVCSRPLPLARRTADIVFRKTRVVLFVDGCFWHGCPEHHTHPKVNADYWKDKIARNKAP